MIGIKGLFTLSMLAVAALTSRANAQFIFPNRTSLYNITFSSNNFSNANAYYQVTLDAYSPNGPATTGSGTVSLKSNHTGFSWTGYGGTSVSNVTESASVANSTYTSNGSTGGSVFSYNTQAETSFNNLGGSFGNTWIVRNDYGGLIGLEFQGGGNGFVDSSGLFTLDVKINGNWSQMGTAAGQTEFVAISPNWTIDKNFVYNGSYTEFIAHKQPYNSDNPNLDFILHSSAAAVPEPGVYAMLAGMGFTGTAFFLRRRKR